MSSITMKQLEMLNQQLTWSGEEWENLFFPILEQENTVENIPTGKKTLYRKDKGKIKIISTVGNNYSVVTNEELHNAVSSFSEELKLDMKMSSCYKNKQTRLIYDIKNRDANIDITGDDGIFIKLEVRNSFDGTELISFSLVELRLKCLNGLSIPIGKTYTMTKKHIGINKEEFFQNVHNFIMKTLNQQNFIKIRERIKKSIENTTPEINFSMLKTLPINQFLPFMEGIKKYSSVPVITKYYNHTYDLTNHNDNTKVKEIILEKSERSDNSRKRIKTEENKLNFMKYNEQIKNMFGVYNLLIKIVQLKVLKHRRLKLSEKFAKQLQI